MWIEGAILLMLAANGYLWFLNRRISLLPANAPHKESWLKDEVLLPITKE